MLQANSLSQTRLLAWILRLVLRHFPNNLLFGFLHPNPMLRRSVSALPYYIAAVEPRFSSAVRKVSIKGAHGTKVEVMRVLWRLRRKLIVVSILIALSGVAVLVPLVPHHFITIGTCPPGSSGPVPGCGEHIRTEYLSISCQIAGTGAWLDSNAEYHFSVRNCGLDLNSGNLPL